MASNLHTAENPESSGKDEFPITNLGTGRQLWDVNTGDSRMLLPAKTSMGIFNAADYNHFPLFTYEMVTEDNLRDLTWLPPRNTTLDCRLTFLVTFLEDERTRHERHPADFSTDGSVRLTRQPCGIPPKIVDWEDRVWYPVFKRHVVLRGDESGSANGDNKVKGETATQLKKWAKTDPTVWSFGTESARYSSRNDGHELILWMAEGGVSWERFAAFDDVIVAWFRMEQNKAWPFLLPKWKEEHPDEVKEARPSARTPARLQVDGPSKTATIFSDNLSGKARQLFTKSTFKTAALIPRSSSTIRRSTSSLFETRTDPTGSPLHYQIGSENLRKRLSDDIEPETKRQKPNPLPVSSPVRAATTSPADGQQTCQRLIQTARPTTIGKAAGRIALLAVRSGQSEQQRLNDQLSLLRELRSLSAEKIQRLQNELQLEQDQHRNLDEAIQSLKADQHPVHRMSALSHESAKILQPFDSSLAAAIKNKVDEEVHAVEDMLPVRLPTPGVDRSETKIKQEQEESVELAAVMDDTHALQECYDDI